MLLKQNEYAAFKTYSGEIIYGKVIVVVGSCYYVLALNGRICGQYDDGLFRFSDSEVVNGAVR